MFRNTRPSWLCTCLLALQLISPVFGQFGIPALENASIPPPVGITIIEEPAGSSPPMRMNILENVPKVEEGQELLPFRIAKIMATGTEIPTTDKPDIFDVEKDGSDWYLRLIRRLDFEASDQNFLLRIQQGSNSVSIGISTLDENDEEVQIDGTEPPNQDLPIQEVEGFPDPIIKIIASDKDAIDKDKLTYEITALIGDKSHFVIDGVGNIRITKPLDYAVNSMHRLKVTVFDSDKLHSDSITITIEVIDLPNLPPEWTDLPSITEISEDTSLGSLIRTVKARDGDYGLNWPIEYSLKHDDIEPPYLEIDKDSGAIKIIRALDAEEIYEKIGGLSIKLTLTAHEIDPDTQQRREVTIGQMDINVKDINDNPPLLCEKLDSPTSACKNEITFTAKIEEESIGILDLDKALIVRDIDLTLQFSTYTAAFDPGTPPVIRNALEIQPSKGSGSTEFSILIKDSSKLDYEDSTVDFSKPFEFKILITETDRPTAIATASILLTVTDKNDNSPVFEPNGVDEYVFYVCENLALGDVLTAVIVPDPLVNPICPGSTTETELKIFATDADKSIGFNTVSYRWYSRKPPLDIDPDTGTMKINDLVNFDYERFKEDTYIVEASDNPSDGSNPKTATIPVRFVILDKNDVPVELIMPTLRPKVKENTPVGTVLEDIEIVAKDPDLTADIQIEITVTSAFKKSKMHPSGFIEIEADDEDVKNWFKLDFIDGNDIHEKKANIIIGSSPDREGDGDQDIDRVDITITAFDRNDAQAPDPPISQSMTITIEDENDNNPYWEDIPEDGVIEVGLMETEFFEEGADQASPSQREIHAFRANDRDQRTSYTFDYSVNGCTATQDVCDELKDLVELDPEPGTITTTGRVILSRKQNRIIDREETKYFGTETDVLSYTISVSDQAQFSYVEVRINIADLNDNTPEWDKKYDAVEYNFPENVADEHEIVKFLANDKDKAGTDGTPSYGVVNYLLPENGFDAFMLDVNTGSLTTTDTYNYNWTDVSKFSVSIEALDYYRSTSPTNPGSNKIQTTVTINILDINDHAPEFLTNPSLTLVSVKEDETVIGVPLSETVMIRDIDDPTTDGNGLFEAEIIKVVKSPDLETPLVPMPFKIGNLLSFNSSLNYKNAEILPTKGFIGEWGQYYVTIKATDKGLHETLSQEETYEIIIENVNFNTPEFEYPLTDNSTKILISLGVQPGRLVTYKGEPVQPAHATDKDDSNSDNGKVEYSIKSNAEDPDDGSSYFTIPNKNSGEIHILKQLENPNAKLYHIYIQASDLGDPPLESVALMTVVIVPTSDRPPLFESKSPQNLTIQETDETVTTEIWEAIDPDWELGDDYPELGDQIVYYYIVGGSKEYFNVEKDPETDKPTITNSQLLDRETIAAHQLVIFVSNSDQAPIETTTPENVNLDDQRFLLINIEVGDEFDAPPTFTRTGIITGGVSTNEADVDDIVTVISVSDLDLDEDMTFEISSPFTASDPLLPATNPFVLEKISSNSARLVLKFQPQPTFTGFYTFKIKVTDLGGLSKEEECKIYMMNENNVVIYKFLNPLEFVTERVDLLSEILTESFGYRGNIDKVMESETSKRTDVRTHFIDVELNEPVLASSITEKQLSPDVETVLFPRLTEAGFSLDRTTIGNPVDTDTDNKLVMYLLIAGVGILLVILLALAATCYFNNRSLSRRVRALTATTFGSQMSGLNRTGAALDLPNTNEFAIEGSNPMWTTDPSEKKMPAFDTESIGSGGSVLIGVEDDEDFKNYKSTNNPLFENNNNSNNMDQGELSDDDLYGNNGDNQKEYTYDSDSDYPANGAGPTDTNFSFNGSGGGDESNPMDDIHYPEDNGDQEELTELPLPPTTRRNPLMNMGFEED